MRRVLLLSAIRRSANGLLDALTSAEINAARMQHFAPQQSQPAASAPLQRGFSAAAVLQEGARAGGDGTSAACGKSPPPPPIAAGAELEHVLEHEEEDGEEEDDEEADAAMADAFERLIAGAFELVQQGKPMEAEYVLLEGAKQAEEIIGKDALEVAALYDQLCIIRFLHDRVEEAAEAAQRALEILREHDEGFGPATAIASTRYAATLLATGNLQEAQLYAGRSIHSLETAIKTLAEFKGEDEEEQEALDETREKFEMGSGESLYYHALAKQAQNMTLPAVGQFLEEMKGGLAKMEEHLGADSPLVAAALREHTRIIMSALEGDQQELAEALYQQDVELHMAAGSNYEHVALALYQCGTLQYVMGKYTEAAESLRMSLEAVMTHYPEAEEHMLTVQQRLGMVTALLGHYEAAKKLLHEVAPALVSALGEGNPASEELQFMLCLIALREMEADGVSDPVRRLECLAGMERHLKALSGYGDQHMLVKKAAELHEEAAAAVHSKEEATHENTHPGHFGNIMPPKSDVPSKSDVRVVKVDREPLGEPLGEPLEESLERIADAVESMAMDMEISLSELHAEYIPREKQEEDKNDRKKSKQSKS